MEILKGTIKKDKNIFRFYPVGQGLFYYGSINDGEITFVYDCGTSSDITNLERCIDHLAQERMDRGIYKELDFVVISHFHRDHINGLPSLKNKIGYKKIYAPYISNDDLIIVSYIKSLLGDNKDLINFLENEDIEFLRESRDNENFSLIKKMFSEWNFDFLVKEISDDKLDKFKKELEKKEINATNVDSNDKKISQIYKKIFKDEDINDTSLMMLHYPEYFEFKEDKNKIIKKVYKKVDIKFTLYTKNIYKKIQPYTLLTGDANFDRFTVEEWNSFKKKNYQNATTKGIVQIPHHGSFTSYENFKKRLGPGGVNPRYKIFSYFIVGYGYKNGYGHPFIDINTDLGEKAVFLTDSIDKKIKFEQQTHAFEYSFNTY